MKQRIKKIFQLKKIHSGNLAVGDVQRTMITSFSIPILERCRILLGSAPISSINEGGGVTAELQTIRTVFYFFKCPFFKTTKTSIAQKKYALSTAPWGDTDFCTIGRYALRCSDLKEKTLKLCENLPKEDQAFVARQVALSKETWESRSFCVRNLTEKERADHNRLEKEFFPNFLKITDDLYFYDGYFLPKPAFGISTFFYKHCLREMFPPNVLNKIRQNNIVDVGGFIADSAIIFEKEFCDKTIYSFEPMRENFETMQKTMAFNHSKRIVAINKGLGAQNETRSISKNGGASSILYNTTDEKETIEITTLDEFVAQNNLKIGFIKVDTEGFEQLFLAGAKKTICEQKPALLISIYHSPDDYFNIKPLIESWNLGYKMRIHKGTDFTLSVETALYCYLPE